MPNPAPSENLPAAIAFLLACATDPGDRCGDPACPGYFVNVDTDTVERCDDCAREHGFTDVADDDVWEAIRAVQAIGRAVPINVTPETLAPKRVLAVDEEYGLETWWDAARNVADLAFAEMLARIDGSTGADALVTVAQADAFLAIARTLPGWNGGPDHAPHPIFVTER